MDATQVNTNVWRSTKPSLENKFTKTRVALKIVHPHLVNTPGFFRRFLREGQMGSKVKHPNVVRTIDVDALSVDGEQMNYMVMEYVRGKSLLSLLEELGTFRASDRAGHQRGDALELSGDPQRHADERSQVEPGGRHDAGGAG